MKEGFPLRKKFLIVIVCFAIAIFGFMLKLPSAFRHIDKELHAVFYFCAAALLNLLFVKRSFIKHTGIFIGLAMFGVAIEWAQAYSNKFFRKRIHGRFDPEDVEANIIGLMAFSAIWILVTACILLYHRSTRNIPD